MNTINDITKLIGTKVQHGSPGYEITETIDTISFFRDLVEIIFKVRVGPDGEENEFFTRMKPDEFSDLLRYQEITYTDLNNGGLSSVILADN